MQSELGSSFEEIVEPHHWRDAAVKARLATFDDDQIVQPDVVASDGTRARGVASTPPQPSVEPFSDSYKVATIRPSEESFLKGSDPPVLIMDTDSQTLIDNRCIVNTGTPEEQWVAPFSESNELDPESGCVEVSRNSSYEHQDVILQNQKRVPPPGLGRYAAAAHFRTPGDILRTAALTVHAAVKISRAERLKRRAKWATKKLIVFILSHVGLTTLVGLYAVAGGFLFQYLEGQRPALIKPHPAIEVIEIQEDGVNFTEVRQRHIEALWNYTFETNVLKPDRWKEEADTVMRLFESHLKKALKDPDKNVTLPLSYADKWTYPSALLFSVTIITTIGYGDTVPVTLEGKVATMLYAVIGIPLVLLCLTNIGSFLAMLFRFTWKHTTHLLAILLRSPKRKDPMLRTSEVRVPISVCVLTMAIYILSGAIIFSRWEHWSFLDGSYFCFITLSTIGFGDFVPGKNTKTLDSNAKRVVCALYLLFGLALLSMIFQLIQDSFTVIVRRYASFLGLSEQQIEKTIEESEHSADEDKGKVIPNGGDPEALPGVFASAKVPVRRESCPAQMHDHLYKETISRALSLPTNHPSRQLRLLRNKQILAAARRALESVPEPDPENDPDQRTDRSEMPVSENMAQEDIKETLYQKYCIPSNTDDLKELQ